MNISFLNPWFLLGLPVVSIPVVIHLLSKKKTITQRFSYIKFIQLASTKVIRRHKLKQILLLILRTLLLLILVLLFARPIVHIAPIFARGRDTSLSTVIVLDNSYSMGYKDKRLKRFTVGRDAAKRILKLMKKYDRTAFLLATDKIEAGIKYLTSDTDILIDEIENSRLSSRVSNLLPAVSEAYSILNGSLSPNKQIIMITDLAENGWAEVNIEAVKNYDNRVKLIIIDLGRDDSVNAAVTGLEKGVMTTGQMLKLKAGISNFSDSAVSNLLVSLLIGRAAGVTRKVDQGFIKLPKNSSKEKDFFCNFSDEGSWLGEVSIKEDGLHVDDRHYFKVSVHKKIKVLCVDGDPGFSSFDKETFYLRLALDPYEKGLSIVPAIITGDELKDRELSEFSVLVSANVKEFDDSEVKRMFNFVKNGGGLVFFLGSNVDGGYYNDVLGGLLPAELLEVNSQENPWSIGYIAAGHPVLKIFSDEKQGDLSLVEFNGWYTARPGENSRVLLRIAPDSGMNKEHEGEPLLVERGLPYPKSGKIMLFTSTVDREWNNFPAKPLFLPLLQQIMSYLTERASGDGYRDSLIIGEPVVIPFRAGALPEKVTLTMPSGKSEDITPVKSREFNGIEYGKADRPGIYTFEWTAAGIKRKESVVYNLDIDSGESDLNKIKLKDLKKGLSETPVILIDNITGLEKVLLSVLYGKEASRLLALFIFGLLILEGYIANRRRNEK